MSRRGLRVAVILRGPFKRLTIALLLTLLVAACSVDSPPASVDVDQAADLDQAADVEPTVGAGAAATETPAPQPAIPEPTAEPFSVDSFNGPLVWAVDEELDGSKALSIGASGTILATRRTISTQTESGEWHRIRGNDELEGFSDVFHGVSDVLATPRGFLVLAGHTIWESTDGVVWTDGYPLDDPERSGAHNLFLHGERVIAPGQFDDQASLWTSVEANQWQHTLLGTDQGFESKADAFVAGPDANVVVGHRVGVNAELEERSPAIWVSVEDGSWQLADLTGDVGGRGGVLTSVAWSDTADLYIAAGWDGVSDQQQGAIIFISEDAQTWEKVANASLNDIPFEGKLREIVATESGILAVGGDEYQDDIPGIFWRSADGTTWEAARIYSRGDAYLYAVEADGNTCIVSGELGTLVGPCFSIPDDATEVE